MACALTSDIALGCRNAIEGIKRVMVTELANKNAITQSGNAITAFTLTTGKQFFIYDFEKETAECSEKKVTSAENGTLYYEQNLKMQFSNLTLTQYNELNLLTQNRTMVIVEDRNGVYWLFGETNGMDVLSDSESNFGKAMGDFNGTMITMQGKEKDGMKTVAANLISSLTTAAS